MVSSPSDLIKFEKQATGENASTWGTKANVAMSRLEEAIADITNIAVTASNYTLDDTQYDEHDDGSNTSESHVAAIKATGTLTGNRQVIVPLRNKQYLVWNATGGAFSLTVIGATGAGIEVPQGSLMQVVCDGTNVEAAGIPVTVDGALAILASQAAASRSNLGLVIGTDVLAPDGDGSSLTDIGVSNLADGTDGELITWSAAGAPDTVAVGTAAQVLTSNGAGAAPTFQDAGSGLTLGTPVASTSGTAIDFTSIPAGTKRITINFDNVSTSGTSKWIIQIGDSGGIETSGYLGTGIKDGTTVTSFTDGFGLPVVAASVSGHGSFSINLLDSSTFTWSGDGAIGNGTGANFFEGAGSKSLSAELDRVRITTQGGSDTFDLGKINISYE